MPNHFNNYFSSVGENLAKSITQSKPKNPKQIKATGSIFLKSTNSDEITKAIKELENG